MRIIWSRALRVSHPASVFNVYWSIDGPCRAGLRIYPIWGTPKPSLVNRSCLVGQKEIRHQTENDTSPALVGAGLEEWSLTDQSELRWSETNHGTLTSATIGERTRADKPGIR